VIRFHRVTKVAGRKAHHRIVLDEIDWTIPLRSRLVILSVQPADSTTLLDIISGAQLPTSGWVERRATVSTSGGHLRSALPMTTPRQLISKLARIYQVDDAGLVFFVEQFANFGDTMDVQLRFLATSMRHKLSLALFYGIPCDFYLFDGRINLGSPDIRDRCRGAFEIRHKEAGAILATTHAAAARTFGGVGGLLHQGHLYMAEHIEDAIAARECLVRDNPQSSPQSVAAASANDLAEPDIELF
jgi:capsular polysaccharide transport system ATP-binding protein